MTPSRGFTLIEVVGAIVIFTLGVLMAARLSEALSSQMETAALRSLVVMEGQERVDSLSQVSYVALSTGSTVDTLTVRGRGFEETVTVSKIGARVLEIQILIEPLDPPGPVFSSTFHAYDPW